jgi:diguanylate cyclase (GGDEF)-like protein
MVEEAKLSSVLSEFARTMVTDFPIERILDSLVERIVTVLPITAAGVTLIAEGKPPRYLAASDESALRFEQLQSELAEGPCVLAYQSGKAVSAPDLASETRFPTFCPLAQEAGLAAVFTFPLRHGRRIALGALDVYRDTAGPLEQHDMEAAQTLADVVAAYLLNADSRKEVEQTADRFHHSSLHDALTDLPNRVLLHERLQHAAQRAQRSHASAAVLFVDLDRFKEVNDRHGHHVGDQLLVAVAHRLAGMVRPGDTLSRVSGDEFVFLCEDLNSEQDAEAIATRITERFAEPFDVKGLHLAVTASVGLAYSGPGAPISEQLLINADMAMYQAKRRGGDRHQVIDLGDMLATNHRNSLETDLRTAITEGALAVAYQPIVRTVDGLVTGVEALLRWTHPDHGEVSPLVAIGIAEQSDLISEIGRWVLEHSCRDRAQWLHDFPDRPLDLSVNVSARQLLSNGFAGIVDNLLSTTDMNPAALVLELTENVLIEDSDRVMTVLADLKSVGVRLALDDFGTGYSSLSYLRRLPVDIVKIDRLFVSNIDDDAESGAIVKAVTDLSHALGLTVIAEGIETMAQRERLAHLGCESSQGYHFAKPMAASAILEHLGTSKTRPLRLPSQRSTPGLMAPPK